MNNSKRWSESELLQVLKLYYAMKKDGLTVSGEASQIEALASSMGRSFAAVSMRLANYKSLDTDGREGLSNGGFNLRNLWEKNREC